MVQGSQYKQTKKARGSASKNKRKRDGSGKRRTREGSRKRGKKVKVKNGQQGPSKMQHEYLKNVHQKIGGDALVGSKRAAPEKGKGGF